MYTENPFAELVRILGKGKNGSRALTMDEAYKAMNMMLVDGRATPMNIADQQAKVMWDVHVKNKYGAAA